MSKNAMKQEHFSIAEDNLVRKKVVRQDRISLTAKKFYLACENLRWEILNVSSFGLAIVCKESELEIVQKNFSTEKSREVLMLSNSIELQTLNVRLARVEKHPQSVFDDYIVGFEAIGEPILIDCIKALEQADDIIAASMHDHAQRSKLPGEFKLLVLEMKEFLGQLKLKIDELEKTAPKDNASENAEFRETVALSFSGYLNQIVPTVYNQIPALIAHVDLATREACAEFIRAHVGQLIYGAPFAYRAYRKPRGYAGDFEMMNHLYRNEVVGESLFDQCMHKYFIDEPAAQAVKNRGEYLLQQIRKTVRESKDGPIKILAIASGPAMEQQLFLKDCKEFQNKEIEFVCIDQDEESLKHAQKQILSIDRFVKSGYKFRFVNLAIKNILGKGLPDSGFDLIYTAGLFDYFTDPVAQMAAAKLYQGLKPEGRLIIGNFSKDNPSQTQMEMVLEWFLIYRSESDMKRLFESIGRDVSVEKEPLGINLFAVIK